MSVYPYRFEPVYVEKIWGGRALERLFGRALPAGVKIGPSGDCAEMNPTAASSRFCDAGRQNRFRPPTEEHHHRTDVDDPM